MKRYTKKHARESIEVYSSHTAWFDESMTQAEMFHLLRNRMGFGECESRVVIASLVLAGAKFKMEK